MPVAQALADLCVVALMQLLALPVAPGLCDARVLPLWVPPMVRVGEEALLPLAQGEGAVEGEVRALGLKVEELARLSVARGLPLPLVLPLRVPDANVETLAAKLALPVPVAAPLVRALPQARAVRVAVDAGGREGEPPPAAACAAHPDLPWAPLQVVGKPGEGAPEVSLDDLEDPLGGGWPGAEFPA